MQANASGEANKEGILANGTELYAEVRGQGPAILFIAGVTGDGGHFEQVARELTDEFAVITCDRRGNSRSPAPAGWTQTFVEEQASDAAVWWLHCRSDQSSYSVPASGGSVALELTLIHPDLVRGVVLREPGTWHILGDQLPALLGQMMATATHPGDRRPTRRGEHCPYVGGRRSLRVAAPGVARAHARQWQTLLLKEMAINSYRPADAAIAAIRDRSVCLPASNRRSPSCPPSAPGSPVWSAPRWASCRVDTPPTWIIRVNLQQRCDPICARC